MGVHTMGKATRRRQMKRAQFMAELALTDPARFSEEWTKRVESWAREAKHNIRVLRDEEGNKTPLNSDLIGYAEDQLAACGLKAYALEAKFTTECLMNECSVALAVAVDRRSYHLTETGDTCDRLKMYKIKRNPQV